jgi:hypothetical protein
LARAGAASCGEQQIRLSGSGKIQEIVARAPQAADTIFAALSTSEQQA